MSAVTEDGSGIHLRQAPRKRASPEIKGFTMLVRVAGQPVPMRVFTDAERAEADLDAVSPGEPLSVPRPAVVMPTLAGTQPGPDGDDVDG